MCRICILLLAMLICSCGSRSAVAPDATGAGQSDGLNVQAGTEELSTPSGLQFPDGLEEVGRSLSDDTVKLLGRDWSEKSETAEEVGTTLELNGGDTAWGIYALGGFGGVEAGSVHASFWTEDDMPCRIYLGVADFSSGRWVFFDAGKDDATFVFPAGGKYHSDSGNCYVSVLRQGEGKAKLYSLSFGRVGATDLESPAGLVATADPGVVNLDWLPVDNAVGYNIYRAYDRKFTDQIRLNEEPVSADA